MSGMEWVKVSERLPQSGKTVRIKTGELITENVLYEDGFFWRLRTSEGGQAYNPDAWAPMEKKVKGIHAD